MLRKPVEWFLFPGLNLPARLRNRILPAHFARSANGGVHAVLDAGCGNGMLAYQNYRLGSQVLSVRIKLCEIVRNRRRFNAYLGVPENRLGIRETNPESAFAGSP